MRKLFYISLFLLPLNLFASVTANCIIDWENMSRGTFDHSTWANGIHGTYHSVGTGTRSRFSIIAEPASYPFPNPVVVSGTTYTGTGTNWFQNDTGTGGADEYVEFYLPGKFTPTVHSLAVAGHFIISVTNQTAADIALDTVIVYPLSGGNWSVSQTAITTASTNINVRSHGQVSGSSTFGGNISVSYGKCYWIVQHRDMTNNLVVVKVYDPASNYSLVGTSTCSTGDENPYWMRFSSGYIGDPLGTVKFGDMVLIYEPTAQQLTDLSTPTATPIIQTTNLFAWSTNTVGAENGITVRSTIYTNLYSSNATAAIIESAINNCPSNQVVKLNAGIYNITNTQINIGADDGVSLRGAGAGQTILKFWSMSTSDLITTTAYTPANFTSITSGYTQGSSNLVVSSTSGFHVGRLAHIAQNDYTNLVYSDTSGTSNMAWMALITATNATQITIWPPMLWTLSNSLSPTVGVLNGPALKRFGIEDLTIESGDGTGNANLSMFSAYSCWVTNVESINCANYHFLFKRCVRNEVRRCYLHGTSSTSGNGILLYQFSDFFRVEDNAGDNLFTVCQTDQASGNVFLYNFATNCYQTGFGQQVGSMNGQHAAHTFFNLWEGNVANQLQVDGYHGSGSHITIFRNWFNGLDDTYTSNRKMIDLGRFSYYCQVVGNVLGWNTWSNASGFTYEMSGEPNYTANPAVYRMGYPNMGNNSLTPAVSITFSGSYPDSRVTNTVNRHGNFDFKNNAQVWDSSNSNHTLPSSYFHDAKPSYFGNCPWPPFDPGAPMSSSATNIPAGYRLLVGEPAAPTGLYSGTAGTFFKR